MSTSDGKFSSILRSFLSHDGVVGGKERWWAGNKDFDFLNDEDEGSNTAKSVEERVNRLVQELSIPDTYRVKPTTDIEIVQRGLNYILHLAIIDENFKNFGSDIFQTFYDIATTSEEPLRQFALLRTEVAAQMWLKHYPTLLPTSFTNSTTNDHSEKKNPNENDEMEDEFDGNEKKNTDEKKKKGKSKVEEKEEEDDEPTPDVILDFIMGIYALERVGIGHDSKEEVRIAASKFTAEDFFDATRDEFILKPNTTDPPLEHSYYIQALNYSFYASKVGIDIKVDLSNVLQILPLYRPYKNFTSLSRLDDDSFDEYASQLTLVFNLIHVLSNNGEFKLSPGLFPLETEFLSSSIHFERALKWKDIHLLGELCHCLRVLGFTEETNSNMKRGLDFIRQEQLLRDGSWRARHDSTEPYYKYHAVMCAISALNPQRFRGFGPSDPRLYQSLLESRFYTKYRHTPASNLDSSNLSSQHNELQELYGSSSYLNVAIPSLKGMSSLEEYYQISSASVGHEINMSSTRYGQSRVKDLLVNKGFKVKGKYKRMISNQAVVIKRRKGSLKRKLQNDDEEEWSHPNETKSGGGGEGGGTGGAGEGVSGGGDRSGSM